MISDRVTTAEVMADTRSPEATSERFAARLRGFGPVGILAIILILAGNFVVAPLSAVLVLIWARFSQTSWGELGL